jgi:hypothetical protein
MALTFVLHAQDSRLHGPAVDIRVYSDHVPVNTLVTDRQGRVITGFDKSRFRLIEDGRKQGINYCVSEDVPV